MEGLNLAQFFAEFKDLKGIDRPTLMSVLEDVFRTQLAKTYGTAENFDIIINIDKGDLQIWRNRTIVEEVEDPMLAPSSRTTTLKSARNIQRKFRCLLSEEEPFST